MTSTRSTVAYFCATSSILSIALSLIPLQAAAAVTKSTNGFDAVIVNVQQGVPVQGDFMVSPTRQQLLLKPGEERTITIDVTNRQGERAVYRVVVEDFAAGDEKNPTILYGEDDGPFPARNWLEPDAHIFALNHGERAYIPVTIRVPKDADPGDHYAALLVQRELDNTVNADKGFNVLSRVGALFLITVDGKVVQEGSLTSLQSRLPLFWSFPVSLGLTAHNAGTVYMAPTGTIEIRNLVGSVVDELPIKDWFVLRNSDRTLRLNWKPLFAFGRYTATTKISIFGQETTPVETSFWVVPAMPVLGTLLAIFLVSFLVQYISNRFEIKRKKS